MLTKTSPPAMNSRSIPLYRLKKLEHLEEIFTLAPISLSIYGNRTLPQTELSCFFAHDDTHLYFGGSCQTCGWFDSAKKNGEFTEGLWGRDVLELFLCQGKSSRYFEFNLSPGGAWWACSFSSYRSREASPLHWEGVKTHSDVQINGWQAALAIPLRILPLSFTSPEKIRANICAILGKEQRQYSSWAHIDSDNPDFHRTDNFESVQVTILDTKL